MIKVITRLLAIIGLILLYLLGIFIIIFIGGDRLFNIFEYLMKKLD